MTRRVSLGALRASLDGPDEVKPGQRWTNRETGRTYPVRSVRDDVIQRDDRLVSLGSDAYVVMLAESDLRDRYVCADPGPSPAVAEGFARAAQRIQDKHDLQATVAGAAPRRPRGARLMPTEGPARPDPKPGKPGKPR